MPVKTLPYSITVLPFEYSRSGGGEAFKKFHLDRVISRELQLWNFFDQVISPSSASQNTTISGDLTIRGTVMEFQASCVPQSIETGAEEEKPKEVEDDPRKRWFKEQENSGGTFDYERGAQDWEWGEDRQSGLRRPSSTGENLDSPDEPFDFELQRNDVHGNLAFIIQIYARRTNEKIYEKVYSDGFNETVTLFTTTPETVDVYVANRLLNRMLKDFLEDLAIEFNQYTQTKDFILKTDLPPPHKWPTAYDL